MYPSIDAFLKDWEHESGSTAKVMAALTDASLAQPVTGDHRTLGRLAWHLVTTLPEMGARVGLASTTVTEEAPIPLSAKELAATYEAAAAELASQVRERWTDATLQEEDDMYGMSWKRGFTLRVLVRHQIHHRGQMTVLMRQAGLRVPGVYGPAQEEWAGMGMAPPAI